VEEMDFSELPEERPPASADASEDAQLKAILEAVVYITDEPLSAQQMAAALQQPIDKIKRLLDEIVLEFAKPLPLTHMIPKDKDCDFNTHRSDSQ
jgi:segregation and condensation protein B